MIAVAVFSDENETPFVGLVADKPERAREIMQIAKDAKTYKFFRAGSGKGTELLVKTYSLLERCAEE